MAIFIRFTNLINAISSNAITAKDQLETKIAVEEKLTNSTAVMLKKILVGLGIAKLSIKNNSNKNDKRTIKYISIVIS